MIFYKEYDRFNCTNPYSATKAGGELLTESFANCYDLPAFSTHTMNVFGERQHPEKYIPRVINKVLDGSKLTIHADSTKTIPGSRHWIHARNVASALVFLLENGIPKERYNIVGEKEIDNLQLAQIISNYLDQPLNYEMVDFHSQRPGHDLRYALDGSKLTGMGFEFPKNFEDSLTKTIYWHLQPENQRWLKH